MSDFKSALEPFNLEAALWADRGGGCLVVDVSGRTEHGQYVASLKQVTEQVDYYLHHANAPTFAATKLYVVGDWTSVGEAEDEQLTGAVKQDLEVSKKAVGDAKEWDMATKCLTGLLQQAKGLKELTWVSGLPFLPSVWDELPTSLTKLVLDLGQPIRLEQNGEVLHRSYITSNEMKPLQDQTQLKELRLFHIHNSFQPMIWETVFRNTSEGGMRVLDVQMASPPIVRSEQWRRAKDVVGLTVPTEDSEGKMYKGLDGKGVLHYSVGTGEYLDDLCIRKARIASGLDEATPLPLWCLRLNGFVLDHLPFEHELSRIVLLTCGEDCIDSGLRAPKTPKAPHNKWSRVVNNATSHCLIQWPNWTGIFDAGGHQRNKSGEVVPQELGLSTPLESLPLSPIVPLTEESLNLKDVDEALGEALHADSFDTPLAPTSSVAPTPLGAVSNASTRGSDVPTPTVASSSTAYSPAFPSVDGSTTTSMVSFASSDLITLDEVNSSEPASASSSFDGAEAAASDVASNVATAGSSTPALEEDDDMSAIVQKVRQSLYLVSGFAS